MSSKLAWISPALIGMLALRLALGVYYVFAIPAWESYDEPGHFQYARYIALTGHLLDPNDPEAIRIYSRFQPPLYYALVAPALTPFDLGKQPVEPDLNPFLYDGSTSVNYVVGSPPNPAMDSAIMALRSGRLVGVLISTLSLIFVYLAGRRLWPSRPSLSLAAASVYGFWPQFVFLGSVMTNDLLVIALSAVLVYVIVRALQDGLTVANTVVMATVVAAAILTKLNGLALAIPMALTVIVGVVRSRPGRATWLALVAVILLVALAVVALSGMEFVTGQVFKLETLEQLWVNLSGPRVAADRLLEMLNYSRRTFIASYGWGKFETWSFVYPVLELIAVVGLIGLIVFLWRRPTEAPSGSRASFGVLLSLPIALVALGLGLSIAQDDPQLMVGRYFLPALPGLALMVCTGWMTLLPDRARAGVLAGLAVIVIGFSAAAPLGVLDPAYALPSTATPDELSDVNTTVSAVFSPGMRLLGAELAEADQPEQPLAVRLCWQADHTIDRNYPLRLTLIGPDGQGYGHTILYPGRGNYPTSLWKPADPFCETYRIVVRGDYPAPALGAVEVSFLVSPDDHTEIPAATLDGVALPTSPRVPAVVHGQSLAETTPPGQPVNLQFGDSIVLDTIALQPHADGQGLEVVLTWRCLAPISADIEVFAHLRSSPTELVAQDDSRPREDRYPTIYWRPGEVIVDRRAFAVDIARASDLAFYVGLYTDAGRLLAVTSSGERLQNDEYVLPLHLSP